MDAGRSDGALSPGSLGPISGLSPHPGDATSRDLDMAKVLGVVSLLALLAFVLWITYQQWVMVVVEMPAWGWAAIILGGGLSLLVGFGLMALMFYSSRHGYDETPHQIERKRK